MKKYLAAIGIFGILLFNSSMSYSQDDATIDDVKQTTDEVTNDEPTSASDTFVATEEPASETQQSFHQSVKRYFVEGGPQFMALVIICLILGLAISIERIIYLNLSSTNTQKLVAAVDSALKSGGIEAARNVCRNTPGPVASIFLEGLSRADEGIEVVEKSLIAYGGVEMGRLERGLTWISLFISLAPMLGFMGTVIGMIQAFDSIAAAGDISPKVVADGIKVALLTTVGGLIVAIILQVFYNYIVSKIDSIVNSMEEASITFIDVLVKNKATKVN